MRGSAVGGILASAVLASCSLGIIDLPPEPSPTVLLVVARITPDQADPSVVRLEVEATLDEGVGPDGAPRSLLDDVLVVEGEAHTPLKPGDPSPRWEASGSYPAPGPEAIGLRLPRVEGLPFPREVAMRVRVDVTPGPVITLAPGDDLVLTAAAPSNASSYVSWYADLTSTTDPSFHVRLSGDGEVWPETVRVPAQELPPGAFPLKARLGIAWSRTVNLSALTEVERYDLELQSILVVDWRVESAS